MSGHPSGISELSSHQGDRTAASAPSISLPAWTAPVVFADFQRIPMMEPIDQQQLVDYYVRFMSVAHCATLEFSSEEERQAVLRETEQRVANYAVSTNHIRQRQIGIVAPHSSDPPAIYQEIDQKPRGDTWDKRLKLFEAAAMSAFEECYGNTSAPPDDIIHVSCSGYVSPSPAQVYLSRRGWLRTGVTHSYQMGCYGAFPAMRTALGVLASSYTSLAKPKERVDIVHTEYLTLHTNYSDVSIGNIVANTLFADGFIKYSAYPLSGFGRLGKRGLKALAMQEWLAPDSSHEMTLRPGPYQFDMFLSKAVPVVIRNSIEEFFTELCLQVGLEFEQVKHELTFAIHPGGTAILNHIRDRLGLDNSQLQLSRDMLFEHGNMASASVPHILQAIVESDEVPVGTKVLSVAFGPGLTLIGGLFEKV